MSDDLPSYARALQSRKKRENQGNLMDENYDEMCFYSSQSRNYNRNEKQNFDSDFQPKQQYQNYDDTQIRRVKRLENDYNQNFDLNYNDPYKERSTRHTRKRRSQPTYVQNSPQQMMQPQYQQQYPQQFQQQYQQQYPQQYPQQNQKNQTHRKRSFPTDKIDVTCSPSISDQQPYDDFNQKATKPIQATKESNFNEVNSKIISELQQKNRDLINEIRALKTIRNDEEINELRVALQTQKNRNAQLFQDLQNSENQVADTKQLLSLKDTTIQNLQDECQKLRIEYQDLLASIRIQNDQIAQLSRRNRELEIEIEKTKLSQQCYNINSSIPFAMNNNNLNQIGNQRFYDNNNINNNNIPQQKLISDRNGISPAPSIPNVTSQNADSNPSNVVQAAYANQNKGNVHPAMRDNLFFEEQPKKADDLNVHDLTDEELREKYNTYTQLKDSKNWILSRAPPKGANFSHVRQEKEKLADECDELARICSKIKLEMKLRGIF